MKKAIILITISALCALALIGCGGHTETAATPATEPEAIMSAEPTAEPETTESVTAECSGERGTMTLALPSGWTYELEDYGEDDTQNRLFGISFAPEDNADARVSVACCSSPIGICGTGVTQESLDEPKGYLYTEEIGGVTWMSFFYDSSDKYGNNIIYADGNIPTQTWEAYREDILGILATVELTVN